MNYKAELQNTFLLAFLVPSIADAITCARAREFALETLPPISDVSRINCVGAHAWRRPVIREEAQDAVDSGRLDVPQRSAPADAS